MKKKIFLEEKGKRFPEVQKDFRGIDFSKNEMERETPNRNPFPERKRGKFLN
jgi:hypothetical protein